MLGPMRSTSAATCVRAISVWSVVALLISACSSHDRHGSSALAARRDGPGLSHAPDGDGGSVGASGDARVSDELPACVTSAQDARQVPLDMYIMLDRSGAMLDP